MENGALVKQLPLDADNIDYGAYTTSLVQEALRVGLLEETALQTLQTQLLALLRGQVAAITHGDSTSVPVETADNLMDGIGYCIDLALKNTPDLHESIALLQTKSMQELYRMGAEQLRACARSCHALLARVRSTRVKTDNIGYHLALDSSLPQLLREWDANPYPHDFAVILEYPLAVEEPLDGIFGIQARLSALAVENRFCARYADKLETLSESYARQNHVSSADAYVNLFSLLLHNLLLARLLERTDPILHPEDLPPLAQLLAGTAEQRTAFILNAAQSILDTCNFQQEKLSAYLLAAARTFAGMINPLTLEMLAVITRGESRLSFTDEKRMENDAFTEIANEILLCDTAAGKARILGEAIHSLADLCDMLGADCLFEEEYSTVFASFDPPVCALILTKLPVDLQDGQLTLQGDAEWQLRFVRWINALPTAQQEILLQIYGEIKDQ